jgi:hypothetical protein
MALRFSTRVGRRTCLSAAGSLENLFAIGRCSYAMPCHRPLPPAHTGVLVIFSADVAGLRRLPLCIVLPGKWLADSFAQDVGVFRAPCCDPAAQALVGLARVAF